MAAQLHTEGRQFLLEVAFTAEQSAPAIYYVGLCTDTTIAENASLSGLTELTDTGYARSALLRGALAFASAGTGTNDRKITTSGISFLATTSGVTWTKAESWFLASTIADTGKLIASGPLNSGSGWTVTEGEELSFDIEMTWPG